MEKLEETPSQPNPAAETVTVNDTFVCETCEQTFKKAEHHRAELKFFVAENDKDTVAAFDRTFCSEKCLLVLMTSAAAELLSDYVSKDPRSSDVL